MRRILSLIPLLIVAVSISACTRSSSENAAEASRLKVSVTFDAMAEFAQAVGKDKIDISTIIPAGIEPHDFEPKAADIARLTSAEVFIYNGLGMETWVETAVNAADNDTLIVINASEHAEALKNNDDEDSGHDGYDPHIWLSIKGAEAQVLMIARGLSEADSENKAFYQENADEYIRELENLYNEYIVKFNALHNKRFVTGHAAFHYFCLDFGLEQNSVADVFAEGEPSTKQLAELVDYCRENGVKTIFAEETANPDIAATLANEVGAQVETIYTMECPEDGLTYLERMKSNCEKVYTSLSK